MSDIILGLTINRMQEQVARLTAELSDAKHAAEVADKLYLARLDEKSNMIERLRAENDSLLAERMEASEICGGLTEELAKRDAENSRLHSVISKAASVWMNANLGIPWEGAIDAAMEAAIKEIRRLRAIGEGSAERERKERFDKIRPTQGL